MSKQLMNRRGQMFAIGLVVWILLACWTVSAFWSHINELSEDYRFAARLGAMAAEVIGLGFLYWHCFDPSIKIRKFALIFSVVLASILVFHAGALRGLRDARLKQNQTEQRLAETLTSMSKQQSAAVADSNKKNSEGLSQRERLANANKANQAQAEIAKGAQVAVAREISGAEDNVKESAIVPRWYLDGWMYGAIFMSAMLMLGFLWWKMSDADDIDANFDGIPDKDQIPQSLPSQLPKQKIPVEPAPVAAKSPEVPSPGPAPSEKPRVVWRGGVSRDDNERSH